MLHAVPSSLSYKGQLYTQSVVSHAGHAVFEMAAGYELTHLRPSQADYKAVDKKVKPILEYIFEEGFPHSISEVILIVCIASFIHINC